MPIHEFGEWYYLIYLIPGGAALFILLSSVLGGHHRLGGHAHVGAHHASLPGHVAVHAALPQISHGGAHAALPQAGHSHGVQAAHSPASHTHAAHNGNAQGEQKSSRDQANDATYTHEHPKVPATLGSFFGIGRVPITMVWGSLFLGWGMFGIYGTAFWSGAAHTPFLFVPFGALSGLIGAVLAGRFTAVLGARMLPETESFAVTSVELFGCRGNVVYPVDSKHGRVHVYDAHGTLHEKEARTTGGTIPRGRSVIVLDFDEEADRLIVEEAPAEGR